MSQPRARATSPQCWTILVSPRTHYYGHSYGGSLAWGLAKYIPERIVSLIISGSHPYPENSYGFRDLLGKGLEPFLAMADRMFGTFMTPEVRARLAANDVAALLAAASLPRPDYTDVLPTMRMPCLLLTGALDPICANVQKAAPLMPDAELVVLPDCDHVANFARTEAVVPPVAAFLAKVAG